MNQRLKQFWYDTGERAVWTFVQTFLAFILAAEIWNAVDKVSLVKQAAAAGIAACLSILKSVVIGKNVGAKDTASTLPAAKDPAAPPPNPPAGG